MSSCPSYETIRACFDPQRSSGSSEPLIEVLQWVYPFTFVVTHQFLPRMPQEQMREYLIEITLHMVHCLRLLTPTEDPQSFIQDRLFTRLQDLSGEVS